MDARRCHPCLCSLGEDLSSSVWDDSVHLLLRSMDQRPWGFLGNEEYTQRLMVENEESGCPGMLGSIDCMHWTRKNCHVAWQGQYRGHCFDPTIILEAAASHDLWIWHPYIDMLGSHQWSQCPPLIFSFWKACWWWQSNLHYVVDHNVYNMGYYLADHIHPPWATIVYTIHKPKGNKEIPLCNLSRICWKGCWESI